ncbi:MAG: hypothetical protein DRI73_10685, partial [Bacteroidetes bacterium]
DYDDNGNKTEEIEYKWDSDTNDWVGAWRNIYTYDTNGNETEMHSYYWDSGISEWVFSYRTVNNYDLNGNKTELTRYKWDTINNDWVGYRLNNYSYDTFGNLTEEIYSKWDSEINAWVYNLKDVHYWSELTTSVSNNIIDPYYIVYPNPFTEYTTIRLTDVVQTQKIELIDIHGRIVRTMDKVNGTSVTIQRDNLTSGIYFIRIHSDDTYVKKVVIR